MNLLKKLVTALLVVAVIFPLFGSFLAKPAKAQEWYNQDFREWYLKVYDKSNPDEVFGERYTAASVQWIIYSLAASFMNNSTSSQILSCIMDPKQAADTCINGLVGTSTTPTLPLEDQKQLNANNKPTPSFISTVLLSPRPISGVGYVVSTIKKFNPVKDAFAQEGVGYTGLSPVRGLWRGVRDLVYFLTIFLVIALAFMIMFRVKLGPQTVVTVQSAIPKVAITLVLVTFSYAIAGFMLDLVYIVIGLISIAFAHSGMFITGQNWLYFFNYLTVGPGIGVNSPILGGEVAFGIGFAGIMLQYAITFFISLLIALFSAGGILSLIPGPHWGLPIALAFIATALLEIALLFIFIKIIVLLFRTFVSIIFLVIFAPIQIALGIITPNFGFSGWLKNLIAKLAVFPTVGVLAVISFVFLGGGYNATGIFGTQLPGGVITMGGNIGGAIYQFLGIQPTFLPPLVKANTFGGGAGDWIPPLSFGGINSSVDLGPLRTAGTIIPLNNPNTIMALVWIVASFMALSMIPKTAELISSFLSGKPFAYGTAIGEALGPIRGIVGAPIALGRFGLGIGTGAIKQGVTGFLGKELQGRLEKAKEARDASKGPAKPGDLITG